VTLPYLVTRTFEATHAISGRQHRFLPGDTLLCDTGQTGQTITIQFEESFLIVEHSTFKSSCIWKNEGVPL
jgi:hypothetical protein